MLHLDHAARFRPESDVLVFLRVPKTASTSLAAMLTEALGDQNAASLPDYHVDGLDYGLARFYDQSRRASKRLVKDAWAGGLQLLNKRTPRANAQLLHGHFPLWAPLRTPRHPHFVITMRDPIQRYLSLYYYYRAKAEKNLKSRSPEKRNIRGRSPDEYARFALSTPIKHRLNSHCLYLDKSGSYEGAVAALESKILAAACVDRLTDLSAVLASFVGRAAPELKWFKVSANRPAENPLSPSVERDLRAALSRDFRLYEYLQSNASKFLDLSRADRQGSRRN